MPKLIVFGPTGQTGQQIIHVALENPANEVTIFIRTPSRLPEDLHDKVTSVVGDVTDEKAVVAALEGQDAVLSGLGTGSNLGTQTIISSGVKNIITGMKQHGVKKFVFVGIAYLLPGYFGGKMWKWVFRKVTADHERALNALKAEGDAVGWVGIMPPQIVDKPHTRNYAWAVDKLPGGEKIMSGDMAHAMVTLVTDEAKWAENNRKVLGVSTLGSTGRSKYDCVLL